jgi:hypothetical protein
MNKFDILNLSIVLGLLIYLAICFYYRQQFKEPKERYRLMNIIGSWNYAVWFNFWTYGKGELMEMVDCSEFWKEMEAENYEY